MGLGRGSKSRYSLGNRRKLQFERLEYRLVLTSNLYLDFGADFPLGGLDVTAAGLANIGGTPNSGPNFIDTTGSQYVSGQPLPGSTPLRLTSLQSVVGTASDDYNQDGIAGDVQDYTSLRDAVVSLVQRYYQPFDVNVLLAPVLPNTAGGGKTASDNYIAGIQSTLGSGTAPAPGEGDTWMFVDEPFRMDTGQPLSKDYKAGTLPNGMPATGLLGLAALDDIGNVNAHDDAAITLADAVLMGSLPQNSDTQLASVTAHEAGHTFGLVHTVGQSTRNPPNAWDTPDALQLAASEMMEWAPASNTYSMFTRFDLTRDQDGGAVNEYAQLANNNNLGLRAGAPAYVTGTGANDIITVTRLTPTVVQVGVSAYRDSGRTSLIATAPTYSLDVSNGLLIDAGAGDDLIKFVDFPSTSVTVRGMAGTDSIEVDNYAPGNANASAFYSHQPVVTGLDGLSSYRGTIDFYKLAGAPNAPIDGALNFQELDFNSTLTIGARVVGFLGTAGSDSLSISTTAAGLRVDDGFTLQPHSFVPLIAPRKGLTVAGFGSDDIFKLQFAGSGASGVSIVGTDRSTYELDFTGGNDNVAINYPGNLGSQSAFKDATVSLGNEFVDIINGQLPETSQQDITLDGLGGDDHFNVNGNSQILGYSGFNFIFHGGGDQDQIVLNDQARMTSGGKFSILGADPDFGGLAGYLTDTGPQQFFAFNNDIETVVYNGGSESDQIEAQPSATAQYIINAYAPYKPLSAGMIGDELDIDFAGTTGRKLVITDKTAGNGHWQFSNRKTVTFTSIEKFNFFDILALGTDTGTASQPLVHVVAADNGEEVTPPFLAYAASYKQGVRVAVGDMDGDGIPEVITAPGKNQSPVIKVFDILTGTELVPYETLAYASTFTDGVNLAVGDVNGDGKNDIVTVPGRGLAEVKVFLNQTGMTDPVANSPERWFYAFPTSFAGGASLALGQINTATPGVEIAVGSGSGMRATVNVFDITQFAKSTSALSTPVIFRQYLPFESTFTGGVSLAVGNAIGDATFDIIVGAGPGGKGRIQILDGRYGGVPTAANSRTVQMFNDSGYNAAVNVAVSDFNNDGIVEVLAAQSADGRSGNKVMRYNPVDQAIAQLYQEINPQFTGMYLATATRVPK